jgi:ABC-type lipoprotein release transport system permease subunit
MPLRRFASIGLLLFLAYRGLWRSPIAFAMLVLAVAAGESFQIPNTANIAGYDAELLSQGVSSGAGDVRARPRKDPHFKDADLLAARIAKLQGVRAAVPVLALPGAIGVGGRWISTPVIGVDADAPRKPFRVPGGAPLARGDRDGIYIGQSLAERLGIRIGDRADVRVILDMAAEVPAALSSGAAAPALPTALATNGAQPPGKRSLGGYSMTLRGVLRGVFSADEVIVVDRQFLIDEIGTPGAASLVLVYSDAPAAAVPLAREVERAFPEVEARAWSEDSAFLGAAIQANRALNAIASAMAMIGVAIPVWALLYVSVAQRRREIGLYGALGFGAGEVFAIFLLQAFVVGALGVSFGALGGYGLVRWFDAHPLFHNDSFVIHPVLSAAALARSMGIILATTVVAGVYPALRAARTDPARALRGLV